MRVCGHVAELGANGDSGGDRAGTAGTEKEKRETDSFTFFWSAMPAIGSSPGAGRRSVAVIETRGGGG